MRFQAASRPACGMVSGAVTVGGACGVRTIARLRPLCPWSKAPDGLPGGGLRAFFRREAPGLGLWGWDVRWRRGPVPEGGRYGKGQGGGFLNSERPGAEL